MTDFNSLYQVHQHPWGSQAPAEVETFIQEFKPGTILDAGVGDGRTSLALAVQGFKIVGVDLAPAAIKAFLAQARDQKIADQVEGVVTDLAEYLPDRLFDNVVSGYTLHFLLKEVFPEVIRRLQNATALGGLHLISDFTQEGPLYKETTSKYWLKSQELPTWYEGWEILNYQEKEVRTRAIDEQGNHLRQMAATIVARKR